MTSYFLVTFLRFVDANLVTSEHWSLSPGAEIQMKKATPIFLLLLLIYLFF